MRQKFNKNFKKKTTQWKKKKNPNFKNNKQGKTKMAQVLSTIEDEGSYIKGGMAKGVKFSPKQLYKAEKMRLKSQRTEINQKAENIRAYGQALAYNVSAPLSEIAAGEAVNRATSVQQLTSGGAKQANKNNEEDEQATSNNNSLSSFPLD